MMLPRRWWAALRRRWYGGRSPEAGDTLIEILVSLVVISIAGAALLAGLLTSAGASVAHRNTTNVDAVLESFAETANVDVARQLLPGSPCVSTFPIVGSPLPSSAPPGTEVTVFAAGFAANSALTASLSPAATTAWPVATTSSSGTATVTFTVPTVAAGSYQLTLTDASSHAAPPVALTIEAAGSAAPATPSYAGFTLSMTASTVDPEAFVAPARAPCHLALTTTDADPGHAASGSLSVVVAALSNLAIPTVTVTPATTTVGVTSAVTLVATVSGLAGGPTGTVTWANLPPGSPAANCSTPTVTLVGGVATCTINDVQAGASAPTATYSGDGTYTGGIGAASVTADKVSPLTFVVAGAPLSTPAPGTLTFTATLTGQDGVPTPTGTITWSGLPPGTSSCTDGTPMALNAGSVTCTVSQVPAGVNYAPTASYSGDGDYLTATATSTPVTVTGATVTVSGPSSPQPLGSTLTYNANVTGNSVAPTGTVTWTFPAGTPGGAQACLPAAVPVTTACTVTAAQAGTFAPTATYTSLDGYPTTSAAAAPVTVSQATPTVSVSGSNLAGVITFTAKLSGGTAVPMTGSVAWSVSVNKGTAPTCATSPLPVNAGSAQVTCTFADAGSKYTATATYAGDGNYTRASGTSGAVQG